MSWWARRARSSACSTTEVSPFLPVLIVVYLACGVAPPHEFLGCFALAHGYLMIAARPASSQRPIDEHDGDDHRDKKGPPQSIMTIPPF